MGNKRVPDKPWRDKDYLIMAYKKRGQSQKEIANACGVTVHTITKWLGKHNITKQRPASGKEIFEDIQRVSEKLDKTPTVSEYNIHGSYSATTVYRYADSWNEALKLANIDVVNRPISKSEFLLDLERVAKQMQQAPTSADYNRLGEYSSSRAYRFFESWSDALSAADVFPN